MFQSQIFAVVVQLLYGVQLFAIPGTAAHQAPLSSTVTWSLLRFMSIESVMLSHYLIVCHPLLILLSIFPSIRVFSSELAVYIRWPKYWSFNFSISPSNEYSGLFSFRIDWFDLLVLSKGLSRVFSSTTVWKHWLSACFGCLRYGPTLTSTHDYWKKHSFDYMDLCRQNDVSAFYYDV